MVSALIAPFYKARMVAFLDGKTEEELEALLAEAASNLTTDQVQLALRVLSGEADRRASPFWEASNR